MNEEPYTLVLADLGKNIREARIAAGWKKQSEFERDCGLKASVLSHIEKGTRGPSLNTFVRICRVLRIRPDVLLGLPALVRTEGDFPIGKEEDWREVIGSRMRYSRERAGLTCKRLGALAGLSGMSISQIENGRGFPSLEALAALSVALKVPAFRLLGFR